MTTPQAEAKAILATVRFEVEQAADHMLSASEKALQLLAAARAGDVDSLDTVERLLLAILEACAFQDLTGQRLTKLETMIVSTGLQAPQDDPLLNGPALAGQGLDQTAADAIFGWKA